MTFVRHGAPRYDLPERVNFDYMKRQGKLVQAMLTGLANEPVENAGERVKNRFVTVEGRANLLRKGEVFPDRSGTGLVVLAFQWRTRNYGMVDTSGHFRIPGLASKKVSYHKAVVEAFRFNEAPGLPTGPLISPRQASLPIASSSSVRCRPRT